MTGYCPCGYKDECSIWCGRGHLDGMCPPWPEYSLEEEW